MALNSKLALAAFLLFSCGETHALEPTPEELVVSRSYIQWLGEPEVVVGENGGARRVFANALLISGLEIGEFEIGSIGVREMYEADRQTLRGVSITERRTDGWFFYETFDVENPSNAMVAEIAPNQCTFCHQQGTDFVMSERDAFGRN